MGMFSKRQPEQKLAEKQERARRDAARAGVDIAGAVAVAHSINHDHAYVTLVVRPDRVEVVNHGKVGSPMKEGAGRTVVPATQVISVATERNAGRAALSIVTSGGTTTYWTSHEEAPMLQQAVEHMVVC